MVPSRKQGIHGSKHGGELWSGRRAQLAAIPRDVPGGHASSPHTCVPHNVRVSVSRRHTLSERHSTAHCTLRPPPGHARLLHQSPAGRVAIILAAGLTAVFGGGGQP